MDGVKNQPEIQFEIGFFSFPTVAKLASVFFPEWQQTSLKNTTLNQNHFILTLAGGKPRGAAPSVHSALASCAAPSLFFPVFLAG